MTMAQCDYLVNATEQACRGTYAAYTYAKQTLGCREYPLLAEASFDPVHTIVHGITTRFVGESVPPLPLDKGSNNSIGTNDKSKTNSTSNSKDQQQNPASNIATTASPDASTNTNQGSSSTAATTPNTNNNGTIINRQPNLQLDDREPHIVKYDVTKKERQKLDMHTDKSEWTFLIALSNGCGVDYEGGGTYFECIDATVHIQRGHALAFPGKLRHCGQKITSGLRFLLVGFLVDKSSSASSGSNNNTSNKSNTNMVSKTTGVSTIAPDGLADGSAGGGFAVSADSATMTVDVKA